MAVTQCSIPASGARAATAYRTGSSILRNAELHARKNYILRVDFQDFFPSLTGKDVAAILDVNRGNLSDDKVTDADLLFVRLVVCRNDSLTIGAPTSPHLSNAIMFQFDEFWSRTAESLGVTYTRYADDLYFSTDQPNVLQPLLEQLRSYITRQSSPALRINNQKTAFSSRKRRKLAAGLVLTSDRKISIGRHRKRILKALVWKLKHKKLEAEQITSLRGWISYVLSVEPAFIASLQR